MYHRFLLEKIYIAKFALFRILKENVLRKCCKVEAEWETEVKRLGEVMQEKTSGKSIRAKLNHFLAAFKTFVRKMFFWVVLCFRVGANGNG